MANLLLRVALFAALAAAVTCAPISELLGNHSATFRDESGQSIVVAVVIDNILETV